MAATVKPLILLLNYYFDRDGINNGAGSQLLNVPAEIMRLF
jgi:hypothetical protein